MRASRGMGIINPSKMPKAKTAVRKDGDRFTKFSEGGDVQQTIDKAFKPVESDYSMRVVGGGGKDEGGAGIGGRAILNKRLDKDLDLEAYLEGSAVKPKGMGAKGEITGGGIKLTKRFKEGGLYENIHKKRARIAAGSGEKMRKPGAPGAPTAQAFKKSALTAKK